MTTTQKQLARHALGLPNNGRCSYRNRFVAGAGHHDYPDWIAMVSLGYAVLDSSRRGMDGCDRFSLTPQGARRAVNRDERLDPEDFPAHRL